MRRPYLVACAIGCALLGRSEWASAAPPKRNCIEAAESGQQLRSSGQLIEARKALAACTASGCPAIVRRDCGRWIEEVDAAQPSVTVKLEDSAGVDTTDGRVLVDGAPMLRGADGRATPVDPGVHKFVWVREAGNVVQELVVREGEHNRVILLRVPSPASGTPDTSKPLPPPPPRARSPLPYVVGGLGIALAGTGGILWGIGLHDRSNLSTSCAAAHTCAQNDVDASRTKLIVGDVLMGVGVIAIVGALFLFLSQRNDSGPSAVLSEIPPSRPFVVRVGASGQRSSEP
jgi:hypothetical protein